MTAPGDRPLPAAVGAPLSAELLARAAQLPRKPAPLSVQGLRVSLRPLDVPRDVDALHAVSNGQPCRAGALSTPAYDADAAIWRYMSGGPFADAAALGAWLQAQVEMPDGLALCVLDAATCRQVGVLDYVANHPEHLKVEIAYVWYSPLVQGTGASAEATYLLLRHAFALGYRRVEWKCDALNERSRRAALSMGFRFEGIQEAHYVVKGRNRDTAWFRMLDHEWPEAGSRLAARLGLTAVQDAGA